MTSVAELPGLEAERVGAWLVERLDGDPPFAFELMAAGGSNLTFRVTDARGACWALRRPPVGRRLATAHDTDREWRILEALHGADIGVPVPRPLARCEEPDVTGAPFFVMEFVDGTILRTEDDGLALDAAAGRAAARSLVEVHARLHAVEADAVGLGDLGPRTGYVERQLRRWKRQIDAHEGRDLAALAAVHGRLVATVPSEGPRPSIVHGDYRFDNVVLGADHTVTAVLDWELCTLGDPIADACWSLAYWADPDDDHTFLPSAPTLADTIPDRSWARDLYEVRAGRPLEAWSWYTAFSWWKMACIVEGVHARYRAGARGGAVPGSLAAIADRADRLGQRAQEAAAAAGI